MRRHELGIVLAQDTGFKIASDPDTVRAPDVAFVGQERRERDILEEELEAVWRGDKSALDALDAYSGKTK